MLVNKVVYNGTTLLDLTSDTVTARTLAKGVTAHDLKGEQITGTRESGGGDYLEDLAAYLLGTGTTLDLTGVTKLDGMFQDTSETRELKVPDVITISGGLLSRSDCLSGPLDLLNLESVEYDETTDLLCSQSSSTYVKWISAPKLHTMKNTRLLSDSFPYREFGGASFPELVDAQGSVFFDRVSCEHRYDGDTYKIHFPKCTHLGSLNVDAGDYDNSSSNDTISVDLTSLVTVDQDLTLKNITISSLPALQSVGRNLSWFSTTGAEFPELSTVGGGVTLYSAELPSIPKLTEVQSLTIGGSTGAISYPLITKILGSLQIVDKGYTSLQLSSLSECGSILLLGVEGPASFPEMTQITALSRNNIFPGVYVTTLYAPKLKSITYKTDSSSAYNVWHGIFYRNSLMTHIDLSSLTEIDGTPEKVTSTYLCSDMSALELVNLPALQRIEAPGFTGLFYNDPLLTEINLPALTTIKYTRSDPSYGWFLNDASLTTLRLPALTTLQGSNVGIIGKNCPLLEVIDLSALVTVGCRVTLGSSLQSRLQTILLDSLSQSYSGSYQWIKIAAPLTKLSLPLFQGNTVAHTDFLPSTLTELTLNPSYKSSIELDPAYGTCWGAGSECTIRWGNTLQFSPSPDRLVITDGDGIINDDNSVSTMTPVTVLLYRKGYCLMTQSYDISDDTTVVLDWSTNGHTVTFDTSGAPSGAPTPRLTVGSFTDFGDPNLIVPDGYKLTYLITADSYLEMTGTLTVTQNTTVTYTWEIQRFIESVITSPFTDNNAAPSTLVDGTNFVLGSSVSGITDAIQDCIVSGPLSYHKNNGVSYGYITFTTPDVETTDTDRLTVEVVCATNAESTYDVGLVYIDTVEHKVTSDVRNSVGTSQSVSGSSGYTSSTFGHVMYYSRGNASTSFLTNTWVLQPNTTYYLGLAYTKDSSLNSGWDRLAIKLIKYYEKV